MTRLSTSITNLVSVNGSDGRPFQKASASALAVAAMLVVAFSIATSPAAAAGHASKNKCVVVLHHSYCTPGPTGPTGSTGAKGLTGEKGATGSGGSPGSN